ncbi:MAG: HAMP domain-containing sensor histidine kinase [Myxococcota bacterium]|nr:HAMP domain-containing sensor histidine kinase [Myxococcota bacterium]
MEEQELQRARSALATEARRWDQALTERVGDWLDAIADLDGESIAARERYYRDSSPFFEAFYRWDRTPGAAEVVWIHPALPLVEDLPSLNRSPCIARTRRSESQASLQEVAEAFQVCAEQATDPQVATFAATEAATRLLALGQPAKAAEALSTANTTPLTLQQGAQRGLSPKRVVLARVLHAEALAQAGRQRLAVAAYEDLVRELINQPGPVLEQTLPVLEGPVRRGLLDLTPGSPMLIVLRDELPRARARLKGWQEVQARLAPRSEPGAELRVVTDPYGAPWLLAYSHLGEARYAAVQVDEAAMLASFADLTPNPELLLVLRPSDGSVRFGSGDTDATLSTQFPRMLAHLRLNYSQRYLDQSRSQYRSSMISTLLSILIGGAIGIAALAARVAADRRQAELTARQREFATRVTHELKTPLAGIRVMAENLELGAAGDPKLVATFASRIVSEADKLTARIDEILAVARTRTLVRTQPYNLEALLDGALDEWEPRFEDSGIELDRHVDDVGEVMGDPSLMRDAFVCLLDNAVKYRRDDRASVVRVRLERRGKQAVLAVSDNGIGVPTNKRQVIFEPFARVEGPDRGLAGGHGLGLSFVADAMKKQQGSVVCEAGIDGGARFVLRLPLQS